VLKLQQGEIALDRRRGTATFVLPHRVGTAELVHPLLAPAAAVMSYWLERESFHASGFVASGGVWGLIGDRGSGKSTTVARLTLDGIGIACDDLLVVTAQRHWRDRVPSTFAARRPSSSASVSTSGSSVRASAGASELALSRARFL